MPLRYIVPDTCALAASLYKELYSAATDPMLQEIRLRTVDAVAPSLGLAEFLNVSRKKLDPKFTNPVLSQAEVDTAVTEFLSLPITWIDVEPFATEAWRLHRVHAIETGDAFFVAVAAEFSAEIWTIATHFTDKTKQIHSGPSITDLKFFPWT